MLTETAVVLSVMEPVLEEEEEEEGADIVRQKRKSPGSETSQNIMSYLNCVVNCKHIRFLLPVLSQYMLTVSSVAEGGFFV